MSEQEVESVLDAINAKGFIPELGGYSKQDWGWSAECDISLYNGVVVFSGAYFSEGCRLPDRFRRKARQMGFYKRRQSNKALKQTEGLQNSPSAA
ncbi:MAG: hypothetical protein ACFFG0_04490 [Candidatus Thorarchaeota archaeon]